jgi:Flp pilus assembly protein TadD
MPKLTPLQWLIHAVAIVFFGFAVFAVTRDYYIRHPVRPAPVQGSAGHAGAESGAQGQPSVLGAASAIPAAITETDPVLLGQQADTLLAAGRFAQAVSVYRRVLELKPDDIETENDLGLALHYAGDTQGALAVLRKGTAAGPGFQRIWLTLGFVSLAAGDRPGAQKALEHARDLGTDNDIGKEAVRLLATVQGTGEAPK